LTLPKPYETNDKPSEGSFDIVSPFIPFSMGDKANAFPTILDTARMAPSEKGLAWTSTSNESVVVYSSQDSFVRGAIEAATKHQHFEIRPDEVWVTILSQMNFYFKKHQDDPNIMAQFDNIQRNTSQVYYFAMMWVPQFSPFEAEIRLRNKTDWIYDWIQPNFTTSTEGDASMAEFIMMADAAPSSHEIAPISCDIGIPSFTLLGTVEDWVRLKYKVSQLKKFGSEATDYQQKLIPIIEHFVYSYQKPFTSNTANMTVVREFWNNMITTKKSKCETTRKISGWITGFHHWDTTGNLLPAVKDDQSDVRIRAIIYPSRDISNFLSAYFTWRICTAADAPGQVEMHAVGGVMGKMIMKGAPLGYVTAMRDANLTLPPSVSDDHHSVLRPMYAYSVVDKPTGRKVCGYPSLN
jgi:hypothetical protein